LKKHREYTKSKMSEARKKIFEHKRKEKERLEEFGKCLLTKLM